MSVNKAILIGNLGRDPELTYTPSGSAVATFSIATTERYTTKDGEKKENTVWHNIVAWGKQAEVIAEYLAKGKKVYIEGKINNRSYDDKDGNKKYISEIVVSSFQFLDARTDADTSSAKAESKPAKQEAEDDDLPF